MVFGPIFFSFPKSSSFSVSYVTTSNFRQSTKVIGRIENNKILYMHTLSLYLVRTSNVLAEAERCYFFLGNLNPEKFLRCFYRRYLL